MEAYETNMNAGDIPESEIFLLDELSEFRIKLHNQRGKAEIIDYREWIKIKDLMADLWVCSFFGHT